jgi:hypothetical protein
MCYYFDDIITWWEGSERYIPDVMGGLLPTLPNRITDSPINITQIRCIVKSKARRRVNAYACACMIQGENENGSSRQTSSSLTLRNGSIYSIHVTYAKHLVKEDFTMEHHKQMSFTCCSVHNKNCTVLLAFHSDGVLSIFKSIWSVPPIRWENVALHCIALCCVPVAYWNAQIITKWSRESMVIYHSNSNSLVH